MNPTDDEIIKQLRRLKPSKIVVYLIGSDEPKEIITPSNKNRWASLRDMIIALPYSRVECYVATPNNGDMMVGVFTKDEILDKEEQQEESNEAPIQFPTELQKPEFVDFLNLMLKSQQVAMGEISKIFMPMLDVYKDMLFMQTDRVNELEKKHEQLLTTVQSMMMQQNTSPADAAMMQFGQALLMNKLGGSNGSTSATPVSLPQGSVDSTNGNPLSNLDVSKIAKIGKMLTDKGIDPLEMLGQLSGESDGQ